MTDKDCYCLHEQHDCMFLAKICFLFSTGLDWQVEPFAALLYVHPSLILDSCHQAEPPSSFTNNEADRGTSIVSLSVLQCLSKALTHKHVLVRGFTHHILSSFPPLVIQPPPFSSSLCDFPFDGRTSVFCCSVCVIFPLAAGWRTAASYPACDCSSKTRCATLGTFPLPYLIIPCSLILPQSRSCSGPPSWKPSPKIFCLLWESVIHDTILYLLTDTNTSFLETCWWVDAAADRNNTMKLHHSVTMVLYQSCFQIHHLMDEHFFIH